jgi:hypothetical protein
VFFMSNANRFPRPDFSARRALIKRLEDAYFTATIHYTTDVSLGAPQNTGPAFDRMIAAERALIAAKGA